MALRVTLSIVALALSMTAIACKKCPPGPPAAGVVLRDAKDKTPICDATVTFEDGAYKELAKSVPLDNSCIYSAIRSRPGSYRVSITAPGHRATTTAISVTRAEEGCQLQGSTVTLELER